MLHREDSAERQNIRRVSRISSRHHVSPGRAHMQPLKGTDEANDQMLADNKILMRNEFY